MKLTITSIELKSIFKFFPLSLYAMHIMKQLKGGNYKGFKKQGFWTSHYTMTLWESEEDLKNFARSGAHLEAMKVGARIAKEVVTLTIDADSFPRWKEAKKMLKEKGKTLKY